MSSLNSFIGPIRITAPTRLAVGLTAVQGSNISAHGCYVKALSPGKTIYVGTTSAVTTATGFPLSDGESIVLEVHNLNELYFISDAAAQAIAIMPFVRN